MMQTTQPPRIWPLMLLPVVIAAVMTPAIVLAASGGGGGFDAVVQGLESRYHVHANRIPFMGLVSGIAGIATHGGVHGLHVAEIENFHGPVDGAEFNAIVEERVGPGWRRMIRETKRNGGEQTLIYVRPEGDRLGLLVVDLDGHELNVVQVSVNPDQLASEIAKHRHGGSADESHEDDSSNSDPDSK